jgi:peptidoglycan/LPS O-acetylase OafA/YrhL
VVWLGLISYGIFLWHLPLQGRILEFLQDHDFFPLGPTLTLEVVSLAASIAIAAVSYYFVELPFLRLKEGRSWPWPLRRRAPLPGQG